LPVEEPAPGLLRIRLPLPYELNHVYVHLVRRQDGWMLIDTGLGDAACTDLLDESLIEAGVQWRDIRDVFLTHTHPDHVGGAREILKRTEARLWMSEGERHWLHHHSPTAHAADWFVPVVTAAGASAAEVEIMDSAFDSVRHVFQPLEPDRLLYGGETISTTIGPLETIHTPGHAAGHLCLYQRGRRLLLSGDHILTNITPNISWISGRDMLGEYHDSLDRVAPLEVDEILPSHGKPFTGLLPWIADSKRHHEERCQMICAALNGGGRTARDILPALWDRDFNAWNLRFALFEVLAHLEHLARRNRVRPIGGTSPDEGRILYWENVP